MASQKSLAALLIDHKDVLSLTTSNRVVCNVTKHEMSARADIVQAHINGNKFKKAREWYNFDFSIFLPHVVLHKHDIKLMFCNLTGQKLNKIPKQIQDHMKGKRFLR